MPGAKQTTATAIPCVQYHDAPAALEWLCHAFGFEKHLVVPGRSDGEVAHAELTFGNGMIMLSSARKTGGPLDEHMGTTSDTGGRCTQSTYLVAADPDSHYRQALAAGAKVVVAIEDKRQGGRGYTVSDPEGNLWFVGSFDPWE